MWRSLVYALASGLLIGSTFCIAAAWPLVLVAIVPLLYAVTTADRLWHAFVYAFVTSVIATGAALVWFLAVLPLDWTGISAPVATAVTVSVWMMVTIVIALPFGAWGIWVARGGVPTRFVHVIEIAVGWVCAENLGAFLYSLFTLGPGTLVGPYFTPTFVGYVLATGGALPLSFAWWGGVYTLSAIVLLTNGVLFVMMRDAQRGAWRHIVYMVSIVSALCAVGMGVPWIARDMTHGTLISVGLVSTHESSVLVNDDTRRKRMYTQMITSVHEGVNRALDVIVLPEGARFFEGVRAYGSDVDARTLRSALPLIVDSHGVRLADGSIGLFVTDEGSGIVSGKQLLIPFGEYMPYLHHALTRALFGSEQEHFAALVAARSYVPARTTAVMPIPRHQGMYVGAASCSEALSPMRYRNLVLLGASILANASSHGMFHDSSFVALATTRMAAVRAAELDRWFVQAGNSAPLLVIDNRGVIVGYDDDMQTHLYEAQAYAKGSHTPYAIFGTWGMLLLLLFLGYGCARYAQKS